MSNYSNIPMRGSFFRTPTDRAFVDAMSEGQALTLVREPENEHDGNAIKVTYTDPEDASFTVHLGYVARETAAWIAPELDEGMASTCVLAAIEREGKRSTYFLTITTDA